MLKTANTTLMMRHVMPSQPMMPTSMPGLLAVGDYRGKAGFNEVDLPLKPCRTCHSRKRDAQKHDPPGTERRRPGFRVRQTAAALSEMSVSESKPRGRTKR